MLDMDSKTDFSVNLSEDDFSVKSCQSIHHEDEPSSHGGPPAYWYEWSCIGCSNGSRGYRCAKFHDHVNYISGSIWCRKCDTFTPAELALWLPL